MLEKKRDSTLSNYIKAFILAVMAGLSIFVSNGTYAASSDVKEELGSRLAVMVWQIKSSFSQPDYSTALFVIVAFVAFAYLIPKIKAKNIKWGIPFSIISALFILLCDSYASVDSWDNVFGSTTALVTSGLRGIGIATLSFFVFDLINRVNIEKAGENDSFDTKRFIRLALIMFACWIPYMIILSPGAMGTDTRDQFAQVLGDPEFSWTISTIVREPGDILLNNHHPVFHTLLLGVFLKFGELVGSYFAGIELYCILQSLVFAGALTYSVMKLRQYGMSKSFSKIVYIFFTLCPLFPLWGMATFKDTPFTIVLLVTVMLLYDAFKAPEKFDGKKYFVLLVTLLLLMLVRNNGFYLVLALVPFVIIHFRKDKKFLLKITSVMLIPLILFKVGYTGIAFDVFGVEEGSPREMLSVPFQQTARYIIEYSDEITPEEERAILGVLGDEDTTLQDIADSYEPCRSDHVKRMYNKYAETDDLVNYFKTWFSQLTKHPGVYVEAFLHLNYSWFSFDSDFDTIYYDGIRDEVIPIYLEGLENPEGLEGARSALHEIVYTVAELPLINCIFEFSFYTWAYVIIFLAMLMRKKHKELLACLPIFANYAICFVGPVAYMRYAIPMVACIPFVIFITFSRNKNCKEETTDLEGNEIWIK